MAAGHAEGDGFVKGSDVSSLPQVEDGGGIFTESGEPGDALEILAAHGVDFVRLRIWHTPADGYCGFEKTMDMAARASALGLRLLLDFHYSDTWADPGKQYKPAAWAGLTTAELADSVYRYTRDVVTALISQNTRPDWVQIGNEITCGMLWDNGLVCNTWDNPAQWIQLRALVKAGIDGVHDAAAGDSIATMIHFADGGDNGGCIWFFDNLLAEGVEFDLIGLSFYPWWHGTLDDLSYNINDLAARYGKRIVVVETAYPFTLGWNDDTHNLVGLESQLLDGYPATAEGQRDFISDLIDTVRNVPGGLGIGIFYWEPAWIAGPPPGSGWENLALFDFAGEVLPSISAFEETPTDASGPEAPNGSLLRQNYPNPFNPSTRIMYELPAGGPVNLSIYDCTGREIRQLVEGYRQRGAHQINWDGRRSDGSRCRGYIQEPEIGRLRLFGNSLQHY